MRNLDTNKSQTTSSVSVRVCLLALLTLLLSLSISTRSSAQCTGGGCAVTISNNSNYTIPAGQTYCLQQAGYTGTITFGGAGAILCIGSGINWSAAGFVFTAASGTINNYGTSTKSFTLPTGYTFNNNTGATYSGTLTMGTGATVNNAATFSGTLSQSGGAFNNNSGGNISGTITQTGGTITNAAGATISTSASIGGTFTNNGTISAGKTISVISGGTFSNTAATSAAVTVVTGATFTNTAAFSGTVTQSGGTINNNSGGNISGAITQTGGNLTNAGGATISTSASIGGTFTNNGTISAGNTISVISGGTFNNTTATSAAASVAAGGTFTNTAAFSGTVTQSGGTINNNSGGNMSGAISVSGGTLNNNSGATLSGAITETGGTIINNSTIAGNITQSAGATITNASGATISGTSAISGTLTNNGNITNTITVNNGGTLTNNNNLGANVVMNTGSTFNNTNGYTGTLTNNGGAITNSGTISNSFTINGTLNNTGTINAAITVGNGGVATNNGTLNGPVTVNAGGTFINNRSLSQPITLAAGSFFTNTANAVSGTLTDNGATITNSGVISSTWTLKGTLNNTGSISNTFVVFSGATVNNTGAISGATTVNSGGILNNNTGGTVSNSLTVTGTFNNTGTVSAATTISGGGLFTNYSGGALTGASTVSGTLINRGAISGAISIANGGIVINNSATNLSASLTMATGSTFNDSTTYNGTFTQNGGTVNNYNGATFNPSSATLNAGTFNNNAGASVTFGNIAFNNYTFTNNGISSLGNITINVGSTVTLTGTSQTVGSVTNNSTFTMAGPGTIGGALTNNSATVNLSGGITVNGGGTNSGTINLTGNLAFTGTFNNTGTVKELQAGCNTLTAGSNTGTGTFNGNGNGLVVSSTPSGTLINGASTTYTTPTQQPTALNIPLTGLTVNGSFSAPAAPVNITGYIVLRYVGIAAPSDNPADYQNYSVGSTIGSSTVVAIISSSTTGSKTFTDNTIPSNQCGKNIYYRIFAFNGGSACQTYNITAPLTGTRAIPAFSAAITASGPTTFCSGGSVTLTATAGSSYIWSTGATTQAISATTSATYIVTVTNSSGCPSTASQSVTVNTAAPVTPFVNINGTGWVSNPVDTLCKGGSIEFAPQPVTGVWVITGPSAFHSNQRDTLITNIQAAQAGTYVASYTDVNGCTASANYTVTVNALPTPTASSTATCPGVAVTIAATGGVSYVWSSGSTTSSTTQAPAATTVYTVTATNAAGCTATANGTITVNPLPIPTITPSGPTTICTGGSVNLVAGGGSTYKWNTGPTTASITVSTTGTYTVTVKSAAGCTASQSQSVTVNTLPTPTASSDTSCSGELDTLTATGGVSYVWSTGATTASITPNPAPVSTTTYTVTATNAAGCTASTNATITVSTNPTPTVNNPATCAGNTATITATGGGTYLWNTGATTASITTATAGVYSVTVTNAYLCSATASGIVTINPLPTPAVNSPTICNGGTATLTATGGAIYTWSTGATTNPITVSPAVTTTYSVTATNSGSCTASASGTVTVAANPTASATGGYICSGSPATLTASGGTGYAWSNGSTSATTTTIVAGTYRVTVTNGAGCTATAQATATAATKPSVNASSATICYGKTATLTASGTGNTYLWSTGATTAAISVSPLVTTYYTVTSTITLTGCTNVATDSVKVNPLPPAFATNGVICSGIPVTVTASGAGVGGSYAWSNLATTASTTVALPINYTVTVTNSNGCSAVATDTVTAGITPVPLVNNAAICNGSSAILTVSGGTTYAWSTGATTSSITVNPGVTTTYTVTAYNGACSATASSTVTVYTNPTTSPSSNTPILLNGTINLLSNAAGSTSYTYSWSGPSSYTSTAANPTITSATALNGGIYSITVTDNHSCTATATTTVILNYTAPGGVSSFMKLWVKANSLGLSNNASVSLWNNDAGGGNNPVQSTAAIQPTFKSTIADYINYYPVVQFNGTSQQMTASSFSGTSSFSQAHVFMIGKPASSTQMGSVIYENQATVGGESGRVNIHYPWAGTVYWDAGTCCGNNRLTTPYPASYVNVPQLWSFSKDQAGTANGTQQQDIRVNGLTVATKASNTGLTGNNSTFYLGSDGAGDYTNGGIAEVIYYLGATINATSERMIESYLATKYGITLDQSTAQNYLESNGTIFWSAAANGAYKNNIFGVGIDNISTLSQTKSMSINTNQLGIYNALGLTYYSFLMVSDNAAGNTVSTATGLPNNINAKLATVWRASQTGTRTSANFVYNRSTASFGYYAPLASSMTGYMLIDSNADGVYETYVAASSAPGTMDTFTANLKNGALFTFGFKATIDFGDAWGVPTTMAAGGAAHQITPGVYLGSLIDAELDGQPSVNALGDDTIGVADEDGVNFNIGVPTSVNIVQAGVTNTISVTASTAGYLNAWIDVDQDNAFGGGSEYAIINKPLVAGINIVTFTVSDSAEYGKTVMRFRFAKNLGDVTAATGLATNGEVEDYQIYVTAPLVGNCTNGFQNPDFEQGPAPAPNNYIITSETNLPYWRTTAADKQVEMWYSGFLGVPAYSGTYFMELEANMLGALYQDVYTTPGTTLLWHFAHRGRGGVDSCNLKIGAPGATITKKIVGDGTSAWGYYTGSYVVPAGQYITRFEFNALYSASGNLSIGNFIDAVSVSSSFDYGDAPNTYSTLLASNGPYHSLSGIYLGANVNCDGDGMPSASAAIDSFDDGVTFPAACASCNSYTVSISAYNNSGSPATIAGWIDFNKNGIFDAAERRSVTIPSSASQQTVGMTFTVTTFSANNATTYARFRMANDSAEIATPFGLATSGEVEDYKVPCVAMPTPVPSYGTPACARGPLALTSTGSAPYYTWSGPNSFSANVQNPTIASAQFSDSGYYRVYAVYANGCATDSAVKVTINNCFVTLAGNVFDDANGNGLINGTEITTNRGQTIYAVLTDTLNKVLATSLTASNGAFSFATVPAYTTNMVILPSVTNPAVGTTAPAASWPANFVGTKGQYGTNNNLGTGAYSTASKLPVSVDIKNVSSVLLGFDQLPTSVIRNYTIGYPLHNSKKSIIPANGLGTLSGSDPEDGAFTSGSTFTVTSLAGMNGNQLFYDANGDGILQAYEQITGYTTITNLDPTKFIVKFTGSGSTSATFNYGSTDAAGQVDPAPATYTIRWSGALPVRLISFTGEKYNDAQAKLKWATASEINNDHFDIERSTDGESWEKIGEVRGAGNSNETLNYTSIDESPKAGANYYRLKQVDIDGQSEYSDMTEVDFGAVADEVHATVMNLYPNPLAAGKGLNIKLDGPSDAIHQITIVNEVGQVVYSNQLPDVQGYQVFGLDLAAGIYIVNVVSQDNHSFSSKLLIQR